MTSSPSASRPEHPTFTSPSKTLLHPSKPPPTPSRRGATYTSPPRDGSISPPKPPPGAPSKPGLFNNLLQRAEKRPPPSRPEPFHFLPRDSGDEHLKQSFENAVVRDGLTVSTLFEIKTREHPKKKGTRAKGKRARARDRCPTSEMTPRYFESEAVEFEDGNRLGEDMELLQIKKNISGKKVGTSGRGVIEVKRQPKTCIAVLEKPPIPPTRHYEAPDPGTKQGESSWEAGKDASESEDFEIQPLRRRSSRPDPGGIQTRRRSRARMMEDEEHLYDMDERPARRRRRATLQKTTRKPMYKPYTSACSKLKNESFVHTMKRARSSLHCADHDSDEPEFVDISVDRKSKLSTRAPSSSDESPEIEVVEIGNTANDSKRESKYSSRKPFFVWTSPGKKVGPNGSDSVIYLDEKGGNDHGSLKSRRATGSKTSAQTESPGKRGGRKGNEGRVSLPMTSKKRKMMGWKERRRQSLPESKQVQSKEKADSYSRFVAKRKGGMSSRGHKAPFRKISPVTTSRWSASEGCGEEGEKDEDDGSDIIEVAILKLSPERKRALELQHGRGKARAQRKIGLSLPIGDCTDGDRKRSEVIKSQTVFTRGMKEEEKNIFGRPKGGAKFEYKSKGMGKEQVIDLSQERSGGGVHPDSGDVINVLSDEECQVVKVGKKATDSSCSKQ